MQNCIILETEDMNDSTVLFKEYHKEFPQKILQ